ncbi:MAG: hypothetical protein OIN85_00695 [Candidatus Methanoperedens sp.]|nr:hypothetical protein [Candidatus Methanoperedens sp.]
MIRDDEFARLVKYAEGMGLKVRFKPYVPYSRVMADWTTDGTELTVYVTCRESKLDLVLSLIHEIGHHRGFIENGRKPDTKIEAAMDDEEKKKNRKIIYENEVHDTKYWEQIYHDTDCRFGLDLLNKQKEFDTWVYEVYYETGKIPTAKERVKKRRALKQKYGR